MCALAGVSRAAYYQAWASSEPLREETALRDVIQRLALANRHYGYRRIGALLRREGWCVNHKRVVRIMREDNLLCLAKPLFRPPTTDARHSWRVWPNLARHLQPMATNQLWVADITYVRLAEAFIYLAVVLDAFSRKVVGWAMADHLRASLALDALEMAMASREVIAGSLVHHSDRGIQYACGDYIARLEAAGTTDVAARPALPSINEVPRTAHICSCSSPTDECLTPTRCPNGASGQRNFPKVSNGFRCEWGAETYAAFRSVVSTAKANQATVLDTIRAALLAEPPPQPG